MLELPGLQRNVPLAPYTTYHIGGPAEYFVEVSSADELAAAVQAARGGGLSFFVFGTGANILISDAGVRGLVIRNRANTTTFNGNRLTAESGATIAELIELTKAHGLSGLEHYVLIPSSVGGAIWQNLHFASVNARLWEQTGELKSDGTRYIAEVVHSATVLDEAGAQLSLSADDLAFGYDISILHRRPLVVLDVTFALTPAPTEAIELQMQANSSWRRAKQPQLEEFPSCGSVFKKIEGVGAGRLISQAGLQGHTHGGIQVSPKHANYLVNQGGGTATQVRELIGLIQQRVKQETGYWLEPEIRFVGEW